MLSSIHFHVRIKEDKPVCSHKIISESQAGNPCTLSTHMPGNLEVKPNRSVRFHLYSNFYAEVKPDKLAYFRIDSFRKPNRTDRQAFAQPSHWEAKPGKPVHSYHQLISENQAGDPRILSIQISYWKLSRAN